jgi:hypothetical protein
MKFRYKNIAPGINRPIIPIQLQYKQSAPISYEVLVDSGADLCIFDAEIGELLGIDVYSGVRQTVKGITGKSEPYFLHEVKIIVGGHAIKAVTGFMRNPGSDWFGVVGQQGFFDKATIKFDYSAKEIDIKFK